MFQFCLVMQELIKKKYTLLQSQAISSFTIPLWTISFRNVFGSRWLVKSWMWLELHVSAGGTHDALQLYVSRQQCLQLHVFVNVYLGLYMCSCWAFGQNLTSLTFTCPHFKVAGNIRWELSQNNAYLWGINFIRTDRISSCINGCRDHFHQTCYWSWRCLELLLQCEHRGSVGTLNSIREKQYLSSCCFLFSVKTVSNLISFSSDGSYCWNESESV